MVSLVKPRTQGSNWGLNIGFKFIIAIHRKESLKYSNIKGVRNYQGKTLMYIYVLFFFYMETSYFYSINKFQIALFDDPFESERDHSLRVDIVDEYSRGNDI